MRANAASVLIGMGYVVDVDFIATNGTPTACDIVWLSQQAQPSEAEIDAAAPNTAANLLVLDRLRVVAKLTGTDLNDKVLRSLLLTTLAEFNLHKDKLNQILNAIDASTDYATLKTNIAAIADYPTRTRPQLITAMTNNINAGDVDA